MRPWQRHARVIAVLLGLLAAFAQTVAQAADDGTLSWSTIEPGQIKLSETATIRVTTLYDRLNSVSLPKVSGLTFQVIGRSQGMELGGGQMIPATYILVRVTPQTLGLYTIPPLAPGLKSLALDVVGDNAPPPYVYHPAPKGPAPLPVKPAPVPKGLKLEQGGAAFVALLIPVKRPLYVGESVPIDIELGGRPEMVRSLNGPPTLTSSDFTLNNLSREPIRREQNIGSNPFVVLTWHTMLAAVKTGSYPLAVTVPLTVQNTAWMFAPLILNGKPLNASPPKDVTIKSPVTALKVVPLPTAGQPADFSGAVGDFQASSDISPVNAAPGEPQTLRLHIKGSGNFDRVSSAMLDHLDHWKTYPVKSSFTPKNEAGYSGEKVFEQPLIAATAGEQVIPALEFAYFNPQTQHYERARTEPIKVTIGASSQAAHAAPAAGLRADHARSGAAVSELVPLYFRSSFAAVPATLLLLLAGGWLAVRPQPMRQRSRAVERACAELAAAARSGDSSSFFDKARQLLVQTLAAKWQLPPEEITAAVLQTRLGAEGEDLTRLLSLAEEAKYSDQRTAIADFQRWIHLIRGQLTDEGQ